MAQCERDHSVPTPKRLSSGFKTFCPPVAVAVAVAASVFGFGFRIWLRITQKIAENSRAAEICRVGFFARIGQTADAAPPLTLPPNAATLPAARTVHARRV